MRGRRRAFTLIEVMVAGAISALVITAVIGGFMGTVESKGAFEEARDISHTAYMILERFRLEMGSAYLSNLGKPSGGEEEDVYTGFFARHNTRGKEDMDEIQFTTLNHVTMPDVISSDHAEIGYMAEYDDRLKTNVLFHREDQTPDFDFEDGGASFLMASGIKAFSLSYYDGVMNEWRSEWDAERSDNMLPMLVRAEIRFETERGNEMIFSTVVRVNQSFNRIKRERQKQP